MNLSSKPFYFMAFAFAASYFLTNYFHPDSIEQQIKVQDALWFFVFLFLTIAFSISGGKKEQ